MNKTLKYFSFVILFLFLILSKYHSIFYHFFDWDEAELMSIAWAMTQGEILYKNIPQFHPIFHFFIFYPFFVLFDPDTVPHLIRIFNIFYIGSVTYTLMAIIYYWLRCYWTSFFAGITMIFYFGYYDWALSSYGEFYTLLPVLYSLLLIIRNTLMNRKKAILIGLLWGVAFFIKQVAVFDAMGIACIFFIINKQNNLKKIKNSVFFIYGFIISGGIAFLYPLFHFSIIPSFDSMILSSVISYSTNNSSGLLSVFELVCRWYWIFKTIIIQFLDGSQMGVIGLIFLILLSLISRVFTPARQNKEEFSLFYGCVFWFVFVIIGISLIGRYYTHYAIQILPPFILFLSFIIKGLFEGSRKTLIAFLSLYLIIINYSIFVRDTNKNGFYYIPEKVRNSLEVADTVKKLCRPDEKIFLLWYENLDVFYLSQRLSNNGIYMFLVMDSKHTNHLRTENERKDIFLKELPRLIIVEDHYPIEFNTPMQTLMKKIIIEKYECIKEIGRTKIYSQI